MDDMIALIFRFSGLTVIYNCNRRKAPVSCLLTEEKSAYKASATEKNLYNLLFKS